MKIINNPLSYLNLLCTLFLTRRMQDIFLCLSKVNIRVASWSALLCSLYHLLVTTATALELLLPHPMVGPGLLVSPELKLAGEDIVDCRLLQDCKLLTIWH